MRFLSIFQTSPRIARLSSWLAALCCTGLLCAQTEPAARRLLLDAARAGESIVAVGERGAIVRSHDSGRTWRRATAPDCATLTGVAFTSEGTQGWAVGHAATILTTKDGGNTWSLAFQGPQKEQSFLDVAVLDAQRIIAVGAYGYALASTDGGKSWTPCKPQETDLHLNRITVAPERTLWIAGEQGSLLLSTDRGQKWERQNLGYDGSLFGLLVLGKKSLLCYGLRGHVFRLGEDESARWAPVPTQVTGLIATGIKLRNGTIVLAGQSRLFLVSRNEGRSFQSWDPGLTTAVAELLQAPDGTLLAFGEAGVSALPAP